MVGNGKLGECFFSAFWEGGLVERQPTTTIVHFDLDLDDNKKKKKLLISFADMAVLADLDLSHNLLG